MLAGRSREIERSLPLAQIFVLSTSRSSTSRSFSEPVPSPSFFPKSINVTIASPPRPRPAFLLTRQRDVPSLPHHHAGGHFLRLPLPQQVSCHLPLHTHADWSAACSCPRRSHRERWRKPTRSSTRKRQKRSNGHGEVLVKHMAGEDTWPDLEVLRLMPLGSLLGGSDEKRFICTWKDMKGKKCSIPRPIRRSGSSARTSSPWHCERWHRWHIFFPFCVFSIIFMSQALHLRSVLTLFLHRTSIVQDGRSLTTV